MVVCNLNINHFKRAPKFYALFSIIIARLIPTLVCAPALYSRNMTVYSPAALRCMLAPGVSALQNLLIVLINMFLPCLIVLFCFAAIFARVRSVSKNVQMANGGLCGKIKNERTKSWSPQMSSSQPKKSPFITKKGSSPVISAAQRASTVNGKFPSKASMYTASLSMSFASMHREIQISKMFAIIFTVFLFG